MMRALILLVLVMFPVAATAATFEGGRSVLIASSTMGNLYAAGGTVALTTAVTADFVGLGGSVVVKGPIAGDVTLVGGDVSLQKAVAGDVRAVGGRIDMTAPVTGDVVALAGSFGNSGGGIRSAFIVAGSVRLMAGAEGPVTIYGNTIELGGVFAGDIRIVASGRITLAENTVIEGALDYQAPEEAGVPESAHIRDGVRYTGASYLPTTEEARAIALASFGIFVFVKILGALILAGLIAGLFPTFATMVATRTFSDPARRRLLNLLLGFAILVATPVLVILLSITFVGLGLAVLLGTLYLLLGLLSGVYAGIIIGALLSKLLFKRTELRASDAVLGMLVMCVVWSIPVVGWLAISLLATYTLGLLTLLAFRFAFPKEEIEG